MNARERRAYAAGFFDGEGCIQIRLPNRKGGCRLFVRLAQKSRKDLEWFKKIWGGGILHSHKARIEGATAEWYCISAGALTFLQEIYPYLRIKKAQARLAIALQKRKKENKRHSYSAKKKKWEMAIAIRIKELKRRQEPPGITTG